MRPAAPDPDRPGRDRFAPDTIRADFAAFVAHFLSTVFTDPHSSKPFEDATGWAEGTTPDVLNDFFAAEADRTPERAREICVAVRCPVLVVQGTADERVPYDVGVTVAEWT